MASINTVASSSFTTLTQEVRPQAGPIPSKRGEIGFIEGVHEQAQGPSQTIDQAPLPARHPADTPVTTPFENPANEAPPPPSGIFGSPPDDSPITDVDKHSFLRHKRLPVFMGIQSTTLVLLGTQLALFTGTVIGWVFAAIALSSSSPPPPPPPPGVGSNAPQDNPAGAGAAHVFVHVAFAVLALTQLLLIERRIYRVRAERYAFKHPAEMPRGSLRRGHSVSSMPVAPWHRPPLPTYAAALASSGVGTGDVEDVDIAQPPPPAYGQTRGSRLILAGFLRNSLRAQAREYEQDRVSTVSGRGDRPISFVSQDEDWEVRRDADRARRIEEALAVLENTRE
jgi:hypothetical protein